MELMKKFFLGIVALLGNTLGAREISFIEVQQITEEILSHHLHYKKLNPDLLQKSCKNFLQQLDPDGSYFLEAEISPYLNLSLEKKEEALLAYKEGKFPLHLSMQALFVSAVQRARRLRAHIRMELLESCGKISYTPQGYSLPFAKDEKEHAERIKNIMQQWLFDYASKHENQILDREDRFLVLQFYEKKRREHEEKFLTSRGEKYPSQISMQILKALGRSLDEYTKVYEEPEIEALRGHLQKKFCGVGITLEESVEGICVTKVLPESPALDADIRVNDYLIAINGKDISSIPFGKVLQKLTGKEGEKVDLVFNRSGKGKIEVSIARREIAEEEKASLTSQFFGEGVLGVFSISSFYEGIGRDIKALYKGLKKQGSIEGIILDLRYNRGGFLEEARETQAFFAQAYNCRPLVVLVSKQTAASAEFFIEALREEGLCIVVGDDRTSGQGVIQHQTITENNSCAYQVTVGELLSPKGHCISATGVASDILIPTKFFRDKKGTKDLLIQRMKSFRPGFFPLLNRSTAFTRLIPRLLANSALRIEEDRNFQAFLGREPKKRDLADEAVSFAYGKEDLPLKEALNVLKDAVFLSKKSRRSR